MSSCPYLAPRVLVSLLLLFGADLTAQTSQSGFVEAFALAPDRQAVLQKLVPGSAEYYYFRCLERQHAGAYRDVPPLLALWRSRHGRTAQLVEIENRQALLTFEEDPQRCYEFLTERLKLRFEHRRDSVQAPRDLPTKLDPDLLSPARLMSQAMERHRGSLAGVRDCALPVVARGDLTKDQVRELLKRLQRPDVPGLAALVLRGLEHRESGGFGSLPIHSKLLRSQLDELLAQRPALLDDGGFVATYLQKLAPSADRSWREDARLRAEQLDRLWGFVQRLSPVHNSLKAHVLYRRLWHDLRAGEPNKERFQRYLKLPRIGALRNREATREFASQREHLVNAQLEFPTGFAAVGKDRALIQAYLEHFFATDADYERYARFLQESWVKRVFAETKLLRGEGEPERWYSLLDPGELEKLRERVEISFPHTRKLRYRGSDPVSIEVDVKNVSQLIVRVFEIDAFAYQRDHGKDVPASIELDGVVANDETTHRYQVSPLLRVRRRFDFPELSKPGTYIVEFLGGGVSSRVLIRKGSLRHVERRSAAGQLLTVLDEDRQPVPGALAWCGGQQYEADENGDVLLPHVPKARTEPLILRRGRVSTVVNVVRKVEEYELAAGAFVQREALLAPFRAKVLVRPLLSLQGASIPLSLLKEPELRITGKDADGAVSTTTIRDLELGSGAELVQEISVPERLRSLEISLRGKVASLSQGEDVELESSAQRFVLNGIDDTSQTRSALLGCSANGWHLDVLGRNGEPRGHLEVSLALFLRDFADVLHVRLRTDERGRIELGWLPGVTALSSSVVEGKWTLPRPRASYDDVVTGTVGSTLRVPDPIASGSTAAGRVSLLEVRGRTWVRDVSERVARANGLLELRGLEAGNYELTSSTGRRIEVRVTEGRKQSGWYLGRDRMLQASGGEPLQITGVRADGELLRVGLAGHGPRTRVHVFATRWMPAYDAFGCLEVARPHVGAESRIDRPSCSYGAGRQLDWEYRYILARRYAKKYPGNMLERPGLLLNPWDLRPADEGDDSDRFDDMIGIGGGRGGRFGGRGGARRRSSAMTLGEPGRFADVGFLAGPSRMLTNLRPDASGSLSVELAKLGPFQHVHVVAVDARNTALQSLALDEKPLVTRSRTLARALDPEKHFAEKRSIEFLPAGSRASIEDASAAELAGYATLADVFQLMQSMSGNRDLSRFAFLTRWPELGGEEKRRLYSEHACHELHLFLYRKDRGFFDEVVRPYLANKIDKTFLDHWLLEQDLGRYVEPWAFGQLNVVEKILLAQRLPARSAAVARRLRDQHELYSVNEGLEDRLFAAALAGRALETGGAGIDAVLRKLGARGQPASSGAPAAPNADREAAPEEEEKESNEDAPFADRMATEKEVLELERRRKVRPVWRSPGDTLELVENNYWHVPIEKQHTWLVSPNGFWLDFAAHEHGLPFCSPRIGEATGSLNEMLLALAVLDLPFAATKPQIERSGSGLVLEPKTPMLLVRKELRPVEAGARAGDILIGQNFFRVGDRYFHVKGERRDKFVEDEFLVHVAYGCQVVLTNPTSAPRRLELLLQVPRGAIPLQGHEYTDGRYVELKPYATRSFEYSFYFPAAGDFAHFPAHVVRKGALVASATPATLHVVSEATAPDTESWQHVSQDAGTDELLRYLSTHNLELRDLSKIAWRMRDESVFRKVLDVLRSRMFYDHVLWSYGILHGDEKAVREYLQHATQFLGSCGPVLDSRLCRIDPIERRSFQWIEFDPLFHARAHGFGGGHRKVDDRLAPQYSAFVSILAHLPRLGSEEWLRVCYHMLLQDRIDEGLGAFEKIDPSALASKIQYDYLRCYVDFFSAEPRVARGIAEGYREHPVTRWRTRFRQVLNHLDEAAGKATRSSDPRDRMQQQTLLAATEPGLELEIEGEDVVLRYQNLARCQVRYYELDPEFSFSANPFERKAASAAGYVRPQREDTVDLPAGRRELRFALPESFRSANVRIEVVAAGLARETTRLSHSFSVQVIESYGQLQVRAPESGRPMQKVYVKVYARLPGGKVRFHKDGYTDLRGRFDYASVSRRVGEKVERFAILVLSENAGAVIREAAP